MPFLYVIDLERNLNNEGIDIPDYVEFVDSMDIVQHYRDTKSRSID